MMNIDYDTIHDLSGWHEEQIKKSKKCGCFCCVSIFSPNEILEWVVESADCPRGPGKTAICPKCGIDSVLPDIIDHEITIEFLEIMNEKYF